MGVDELRRLSAKLSPLVAVKPLAWLLKAVWPEVTPGQDREICSLAA
jgi:hypothetical protein